MTSGQHQHHSSSSTGHKLSKQTSAPTNQQGSEKEKISLSILPLRKSHELVPSQPHVVDSALSGAAPNNSMQSQVSQRKSSMKSPNSKRGSIFSIGWSGNVGTKGEIELSDTDYAKKEGGPVNQEVLMVRMESSFELAVM